MAATRSAPAGAAHRSIMLDDARLGVLRELVVVGASAAYSAAYIPARRPNTLMSSSELVPSRFAPCTDTQATSPAAYRPGMTVVVGAAPRP